MPPNFHGGVSDCRPSHYDDAGIYRSLRRLRQRVAYDP
jgi:hypothetical protein